MGKQLITLFVVLCLFVGCQANDRETEDLQTEGERQEQNKQESTGGDRNIEKESYQKYLQSEEKGIGKDGFKEQLFSSDEQREIEQHIIQMENVEYVHVEVYEDRLNIAVSVRKGSYEELEDEIYDYITDHFPQREIQIFVTQITT